MKNEKNVNSLKQQLEAIGFGDGQETNLRSGICFQPASFDVPFRLQKDDDVVSFRIHVEAGDGAQYSCNYYDAVLRRAVDIPAAGGPLESKMRMVDWADIARHTEEIEEVVSGLLSLAADADGKKAADLLKYKYWSGTPAEHLIPNVLAFKSQYETNQRFYLSEGQGITAEEAYRFLCNRWLEKKLLARRKENGMKGGVAADTGNKAGHKRK